MLYIALVEYYTSKAINKKTLSQHEKFYLLPYDKEQKLSVDSNNNVKYWHKQGREKNK